MKRIYLLLLLAFIGFQQFAMAQALTGITPNSAVHGQSLTTTITGTGGIFQQSISPAGNIYSISLEQGAYAISIYDHWICWGWCNTTVVNTSTVTTDNFGIPLNAPSGLYTLKVITGDVFDPTWNQMTYTLPNAFTVSPPDGYAQGTLYHDLNQNGVKDAGEPGLSGRNVRIIQNSFMVQTDANGNFSIPLQNGTYDLHPVIYSTNWIYPTSADTIPFTINNGNVTGLDIGFKYALQSITPNFAYRGVNGAHQIVSSEPIFSTGANSWGNISQMRVLTSPSGYTVPNANITVINSYTIQFNMNIPVNTTPQNDISLWIRLSNNYIHYLNNALDILTPPYFISGKAFFDQNQNKIADTLEPGIRQMKMVMAPQNSISFTDLFGNYQLGSTGGGQNLTHNNTDPGLVLFTDSTSYTFTPTANVTGKNFGFISTYPDYSIDVSGVSLFARCNTQQNVEFRIRNMSNVTYNARAWVKFDPQMTFVSSIPSGATVSNDTVYVNISSLLPFLETRVFFKFSLPGAGTSVTFTGGATSMNAGNVPQFTDSQLKNYNIFCAWDPNDKQVTPPGIFAQNYTLMSDTLEYLIRFQNTGTDTAFKVVIIDTLDADLEINTFDLLGSSHNMMTEIKANGAMTFTFNNINLPDSNVNEPGSHGWILYRIRAKTGLTDGTPVNNTAHIFFDFNPAVVTNTTLNTMVYVLPTGLDEIGDEASALFYPNPMQETATIHFGNKHKELHTLTITDVTGKSVRTPQYSSSDQFTVDRKGLSAGLYFYRIVNSSTGRDMTGKFIVH